MDEGSEHLGIQELRIGDILGRYELVCVLAQGGMGSVWLAKANGIHGFERLVALKTILPAFRSDERFRTMFLDEARIASRIVHENVVSILDVGDSNGTLYFAMEYVEGESIRRFYKALSEAGAFHQGLALRLTAEICAGLHAAHELRDDDGTPLEVVHRDVSPQNLLVTPRGSVKIIDFGVARARDRLSQATESGTLKGKLNYMAPEQARGAKIDRRADIYSLGAILYFLLSGKTLHDTPDGNQLAILHKLMSGDTYDPLPVSIHPAIRAVVTKALAAEPDQRFQTMSEFAAAIEQAMVLASEFASSSDVANAFSAHVAPKLAERRDAIRRAMLVAKKRRAELPAPLESSSGFFPPSHTTVSGSTAVVDTAPSVPRRRSPRPFLMAAAGCVLVLFGVGLRSLSDVSRGPSSATSAPVAAAKTEPVHSPEPAREELREPVLVPPSPGSENVEITQANVTVVPATTTLEPAVKPIRKKAPLAPLRREKKAGAKSAEPVDDGF